MGSYNFTKNIEIKTHVLHNSFGDALIFAVDEENTSKLLANCELKTLGVLSKKDVEFVQKIVKNSMFHGKCGDILTIHGLPEAKFDSIVLVGLGCCKSCPCKHTNDMFPRFEIKGGKICDEIIKNKSKNVAILVANINDKMQEEMDIMALGIASGIVQKAYRFSKHITCEKKLENLPNLANVTILTDSSMSCKVKHQNLLLESIYITRDLCNEPANVIYPEKYAQIIREEMENIPNVTVKILELAELEDLKMGALLGVAMGSNNEPKVVVVEYMGDPEKYDYDIALVGKGVTFDSGGLSIKPADSMEDMKGDMAGSATAFSSVRMLAKRGAKVNALCVVGLVENVINGFAQKPGDIVKSMSGKTIEVLNTDAEGRLVLADVLYYTATKYNCDRIIDFATLTGAVVIALGFEYAGLFSNNDCFAKSLEEVSIESGDKCWKLPLGKEYDKNIDSQIADVKNIGTVRGAGATMGAQFLQRFINNHEKWAHIDIGGTGGILKETPLSKCGAAGFGLKLIDRYIKKNLEHCCCANKVEELVVKCDIPGNNDKKGGCCSSS